MLKFLRKGDAPAESLRLSPGRHTLEFRYTGLSFDAPERVRFRYRLDRLEPEWVEAGTRHAAFYSFVPPGAYRFEVIACNGDGVWNRDGASLSLAVLPHFWVTNWRSWVSRRRPTSTATSLERWSSAQGQPSCLTRTWTRCPCLTPTGGRMILAEN